MSNSCYDNRLTEAEKDRERIVSLVRRASEIAAGLRDEVSFEDILLEHARSDASRIKDVDKAWHRAEAADELGYFIAGTAFSERADELNAKNLRVEAILGNFKGPFRSAFIDFTPEELDPQQARIEYDLAGYEENWGGGLGY